LAKARRFSCAPPAGLLPFLDLAGRRPSVLRHCGGSLLASDRHGLDRQDDAAPP